MIRSNILNIITLLQLFSLIEGASIKLPIHESGATDGDIAVINNDQPQNETSLLPTENFHGLLPSTSFSSTPGISRRAAANLVQKVITVLRTSPPPSSIPSKQLFGGALPSFIERVVQRIQNYFSVYNPPVYFEGNRPPVVTEDKPGISIICSNAENDSVSCTSALGNESEYEEECEQNTVEGNVNQQVDEDSIGYNVVVTHTVIQDDMINVYSPPRSGQIVSNVVLILKPSGNPVQPVTEGNKFYVYVNPTKTNIFDTNSNMDTIEKREELKPRNFTYSVFIEGNKLKESNDNLGNVDKSLSNTGISPLVHVSGTEKIVRNKCGKGENCITNLFDTRSVENTVQSSRSAQDVPNINLVLVPSEQLPNKSCNKSKYDNLNIEYFVLKPDDGNLSKPKNASNTYSLHKTKIDGISATYLPPKVLDDEDVSQGNVTNGCSMKVTEQSSITRLPLLFNLLKKKSEEPRIL